MALWIKQYLATFEAQFIKKLSNTEAELKKSVTYKKKRVKFFAQNIWKENITKHLCYFLKFSGQDHLHKHYCTVEQLVGEALIEIESAVAKQKTFYQWQFFYHRQRDIQKLILNLVLE